MKIFYTLILMCLLTVPSYSQQADSAQVAKDSITYQLQEYNKLMAEGARKRIEDSLKKAELMAQIQLLKEHDKLKQAELLSQIQQIEQKDSLRNEERKNKILKMKETAKGYAVAPFEDTLFVIYTKIGPVMPQERAANIARKIDLLYHDDFFQPDSIEIVNNEASIDIAYHDLILMSITDWDALWMDQSKEQIAKAYADKIKTAIQEERTNNSFKNILMRIGLAALILAGTWLLIFLLNRLFRKGNLWVIRQKEHYFKGIRFRGYEFLPPNRQLEVVLKLLQLLKWTIFVVLMYISLPLVFSIFPFTKGWAETLFNWVWHPARDIFMAIWGYLPNLFTIAVIYLATRYTVQFFKFISHEIQSERLKVPGFYHDWAMPTFSIVKFLLYAFMFVVVFPYLPGSDSAVFQGVSVFLGILFSLGSSTAIANAVAGLVITYMRPFKIGDRIKVGEITGDVIEKSLLVTRVRTVKNEDITVPNASILTGHTINYSTSSRELGLILHTTVTIGYDVPWRQVHQLLIDAAHATEGVNKEKQPFVLQTSLDDYYVSYQLNAYTEAAHRMAAIYSGLHQNIQDKFNESGVEILSPHYRALRDGNMVTIPSDYLPHDYQVPAFNVNSNNSVIH